MILLPQRLTCTLRGARRRNQPLACTPGFNDTINTSRSKAPTRARHLSKSPTANGLATGMSAWRRRLRQGNSCCTAPQGWSASIPGSSPFPAGTYHVGYIQCLDVVQPGRHRRRDRRNAPNRQSAPVSRALHYRSRPGREPRGTQHRPDGPPRQFRTDFDRGYRATSPWSGSESRSDTLVDAGVTPDGADLAGQVYKLRWEKVGSDRPRRRGYSISRNARKHSTALLALTGASLFAACGGNVSGDLTTAALGQSGDAVITMAAVMDRNVEMSCMSLDLMTSDGKPPRTTSGQLASKVILGSGTIFDGASEVVGSKQIAPGTYSIISVDCKPPGGKTAT